VQIGALQTPSFNPLPGRPVRATDHALEFLDDAIPLEGASHCDVVRYAVETKWRNAECIAILTDGSRAKLSDSWQFMGYAGRDPVESLLFCRNGEYFELHIGAEHLRIVNRNRYYTGIDGSQVILGA